MDAAEDEWVELSGLWPDLVVVAMASRLLTPVRCSFSGRLSQWVFPTFYQKADVEGAAI